MEKITAIASFEFWWDCPHCKGENRQGASCVQMKTSDDGNWDIPATLKNPVERECAHCGQSIIITSVLY